MRPSIVAGNWKMHGSKASVAELLAGLREKESQIKDVEVVVCPPAIFIDQAERALLGSQLILGAQDVNANEIGAHTGEIALSMLEEFSCRYVIVGHSERRSLYGESDEMAAEKVFASISAGLIPVLCVGESLEERQQGKTNAVVVEQLRAVIARVGVASFAKIVVAYEPVWAIGTGHSATPEQAQEVHAVIRRCIAEEDATVAGQLPILYGGSVKPGNAAELFAMPDIDGGLIGGASLKADDFMSICMAASEK